MSLSAKSRRILGLALLIAAVFSRVATGQAIGPAGVHTSHVIPSLCQSCSKWLLASSYEREVAFSSGRSRKAHVLLGLVGGIVVGVLAGELRGSDDKGRCLKIKNTDTCGLVEVNDMVWGGLYGGLLGTIVGAFWPIQK
jgi:hypothetical protein